MEKFYEHLEFECNFREITIKNYKSVLKKVLRDLGTLKPRKKQVEEYLLAMKKKKYSASHLNNTISILDRYMKFIKRKIEVKRVKRPKPIIKDTLTEGEIARMLAAGKNSREQAMMAILAYSGIRNGEFCHLKVKDVDLDNGLVKIFNGKGGRDGISYISRECIKIVSRYLNEYPRNDDDSLFTTLVRNNQYTGWDLRKRVKVVAKRAGISKRVFPHLFRHSLATNLIKKGANIITVQNQLRHENLQNTMIYIRSFPERVQTEYNFHVPNYV